MSYGLWIGVVVPVIAAGEALHFKLKEQSEKSWYILPKCLATWMIVCTAALGIFQNGNVNHSRWILYAMCFFIVADGLLELRFFWGMAVFAAGHAWLIGWFFVQGYFQALSIPVWILGMAGTLVLFRKELEEGKKDPRIYLMILYPAVLLIMASVALLLPFAAGAKYSWAAFGAVLFSISDMMVGKGFFHKLSNKMDYLALAMYYSGIFCLAMMTWVV